MSRLYNFSIPSTSFRAEPFIHLLWCPHGARLGVGEFLLICLPSWGNALTRASQWSVNGKFVLSHGTFFGPSEVESGRCMFGVLERFTDPDGYAAKQRAKLGIAACLIVLYTIWKSVVEVQFLFIAATTTATSVDRNHVVYQDETETRRERLDVGAAESAQVQIDYLPGVGLARIHGSRNWTPFIMLLVASLIAFVFLLPVIREARDFAEGSNRRSRRR